MSKITLKVKLSVALLLLVVSMWTPVFAMSLIPASGAAAPMAMKKGTTAS
jgi:hypothetical protein